MSGLRENCKEPYRQQAGCIISLALMLVTDYVGTGLGAKSNFRTFPYPFLLKSCVELRLMNYTL